MPDHQAPQGPVDRGSATIAAGMIAASLVISWGMSSSQPRYQLAASGDTVVRMDTDSGELIACNQQRCARVEPPDRAKIFGPLTIKYDSKPEAALPSTAPPEKPTKP